jgi:hypothetical protein
MIKLHKPKVNIKTGEITNQAHVKVNIKSDLNPHEAMMIGQRLIDLASKAQSLNRRVTK